MNYSLQDQGYQPPQQPPSYVPPGFPPAQQGPMAYGGGHPGQQPGYPPIVTQPQMNDGEFNLKKKLLLFVIN